MSYPSAYVQSLSDTVLTATASASMNTSSSETKDGDGTVVDEEHILSQAGDAKTESEDKSSYYHGSIKTSEAETRLNGHISCIQVPNSKGKNILQDYKEAATVVEDMINSSASCQNPVPSLIINLVLIYTVFI